MSETARWAGPAPPQQQRAQPVNGRSDGANLADILERVLDKGIVIAGDIQVNLLDIELLTIKIRLVVASVERAKEMGIDWWERDPTLSAGRRELEDENRDLRARIEALEQGGHGDPDERELSDGVSDDEDDHRPGPEEPEDRVPDEYDGPAGGAGRSGRARSGRSETAASDDHPEQPESARNGRGGRSRGRTSRSGAEPGVDEPEMPVRRKPGSKRSSTSRER